MAHFDRAIPPGGEGKITLRMNLKGYQGTVKKSATAFTNDPKNSRVVLTMEGLVKSLLEIRPSSLVTFRGMADQVPENTIDIAGTADEPFHIQKTETSLDGKINYHLETVEEGKLYRLKISNALKQGNYSGFVKLYTDLPQKPDIVIRVTGFIEGEIAAKPQTLLVGKLTAQQPVRVGRVLVQNNRGKPFQITKLSYDEQLMKVEVQPVPNEHAYTLEITPRIENIPAGSREQKTLTIETDAAPQEKLEVQVHLMNASGGPSSPQSGSADGHPPASSTQKDVTGDKGTK